MPISIEINEKDAKDLIEFYVEKQRSIKSQMAILGSSLKEISAKILELKEQLQAQSTIATGTSDNSDYSSKWHWVKKIEFAINKAGKPLTTKEIVDILTDYQPEYISERRSAIASVSATLSAKSGNYFQHKQFVKNPSDWGEYTYDIWREEVIIEEPVGDEIIIDNSNKANAEPADDFPF